MTNGAQVTVSGGGGGACNACQCFSGPSPRVETTPTPVIQASRAASPMVSAMNRNLQREAERRGGLLHVRAQFGVRKFGDPEGHLRVAGQLAADADLRLGARKARAFMQQRRADIEHISRLHER